MSIKCGHCRGYHETIDAVKACSKGEPVPNVGATVSEEPNLRWVAKLRDGLFNRRNQPYLSASQYGFIMELAEKRARASGVLKQAMAIVGITDANRLTKREASVIIEHLLTLPGAPSAVPAPFPTVATWAKVNALAAQLPAFEHCYYAIQVVDFEQGPDAVWKFYRVDKPQDGRWAGKTFLKVQASDEFHRVQSPESQIAIFTAILHDPKRAALDYGIQIEQCCICHRTLTDTESRARGIGPVCAGKVGWAS